VASEIEATKLAPTGSGSLFKILEDHPLPGSVDELNFCRKIRFRLSSTRELELVEPLTTKNLRFKDLALHLRFPIRVKYVASTVEPSLRASRKAGLDL
jgi:hypothetical protein